MKQKMIDYYSDVVRRTAELSYAKRLKVGAILIKDDSIISHSWNGMPRGWDNCCENKIYYDEKQALEITKRNMEFPFVDEDGRYRLESKPEVIHAEEAMIMKTAHYGRQTKGSIVFCTHGCCVHCAKILHGSYRDWETACLS